MKRIGSPVARSHSSLCHSLRVIAASVFIGGLTSCTSNPVAWVSGGDVETGERLDPYVQFTQAVTAVEPLVSPELDALARSQSDDYSLGNGVNGVQSSGLLPKVVPLEVDGDLAIATTPNLLPLNEAMYERFVQSGYRGIMDINAVTSSKAVQQFCQPDGPSILTISRPMTEAEISACQVRSPVGIAFGKDALVLVVNSQNEFLQGVTLGKLSAILTQNTWSSINAGWPQQPIIRHLIGPDSDTVTLLANTLFEGENAIANTENTQYFDYEEPMVQSLSTTAGGVGLLSYSTYRRSLSTFKALPINGITASPDTISQGVYPLPKTLYLYVDQQQLQGRSPAKDWVNYHLTYMTEVMPEVELLPLNGSQHQTSVSQWLALIKN